MKANHNKTENKQNTVIVVVNLANWQNESKSQLLRNWDFLNTVVVNLANWQNESKSQLSNLLPSFVDGCSKSR